MCSSSCDNIKVSYILYLLFICYFILVEVQFSETAIIRILPPCTLGLFVYCLLMYHILETRFFTSGYRLWILAILESLSGEHLNFQMLLNTCSESDHFYLLQITNILAQIWSWLHFLIISVFFYYIYIIFSIIISLSSPT